jgi:Ca2+:H+ antiporter
MIFAWLLVLVPIPLVLRYALHDVRPVWVVLAAAAAIVPLAAWIRRATEQMAKLSGPAVGGLLNVTFGNAAELILMLFVLRTGNTAVVKGQITGSIIGNGLLGLGLAILVGSVGRAKQTFDRERATLLSILLVLVVIALLLPALFNYTERGLYRAPNARQLDERFSLAVSVVLMGMYAANLIYTLYTHRDVFQIKHEDGEAKWSAWVAIGVLLGGTALTALEAELVSGALEATAAQLGLTSFFLGVIVLAIVGNAAEYAAGIYFARRDQMDLVITIMAGSTIQVALLVAPVLVLVSYFIGQPMNLVFTNPLELIAIVAVAFAVTAIAQDGKSTWFEGLLLVAVYALLALAFFFATP